MNGEISAGDEAAFDTNQSGLVRRVSRGCGWGAMGLGALALASSSLGLPAMDRLGPDFFPSSPASAVALLLLGAAMLVGLGSSVPRRRLLCLAILLPVFVLAILSLSGVHPAAETALAERLRPGAGAVPSPWPLQMPPISAVCFLLLGIGIGLRADGRSPMKAALAGWAGSGVGFVSFVIVLGYCYGTPPLYGGPARPAGLITAVSSLALGLALVVAAGPRQFPMNLVAGSSTRARLVRGFVPVVFGAVFLTDLVSQRVPGLALNPALEDAVHALVSLVILGALVSTLARRVGNRLDRAEASRRQTEEELGLSQQRAQAVLDAVTESIMLLDREGTILTANATLARRLGRPLEALLGRNAYSFIAPDLAQARKARIAEAMSIGQPVRYEDEREGIQFDHHVYPIRDASGWVSGVAIFGLDITERRQAETALRESEARFRELSEASFEGIAFTQDGRFVDVNSRFAEMFGCPRSAILGRPVEDFVAPDYRARIRDHIRSGSFEACEHEARRADGTVFLAEVQARTAQLRGGTVRVAAVRDLTERKRAEAALRESEEKYRRLHETMTDAFVIVRMDGRIQEWNRAYQEMLGYANEELLRLTYVDLTPEKWHEIEARIVAEQVLPHGCSEVYQKEYRRKDGTVLPVELRTFLIRDPAGQPAAMWAIVRDVTERKQVEEALRESAQQFRNLAENSPNMVFINSGGRVLYANLRCSEVMGYPREVFTGEGFNFLTLIAPDSVACVRESFERHRQGGEVPAYECALITCAGHRLDTIINTRLIRYQGQRAILGIVTDITDRKRAEDAIRQLNRTLEQRVRERTAQLEAANQALRRNEERLALAQEAGHIGTWDWDLVTNQTVWTRETEALFGLPPGAFDGSSNPRWEQFLHPDDRPRMLALVRESIAQKGSGQTEYRILWPDGSIRWIANSWTVVCNDLGEPVRVVGVNWDLTERKRTEEQLRIFSRAVEQSSVAVIITDPQGAIEQVNAKFSQVTGYSLDEVRGQNPRLLKSGETPPEEYARLWQTITAGGEWHGLFHNKKKSGALFWESASISPLLDEAGRITHFVAIKEDITDQRHVAECNTALGRLGHQLSAASTPAEAGRIILDVASELLGWDAAFLHLISPRGELDPVITMDDFEGRREEVPATSLESLQPSWLMLEVIRSGGRLLEASDESQPPLPLVPFGNTARRSACRLYAPIRQGPRTVGVMSIQSYTPKTYTEESLRFFQSLADHCAGALERIRSAAALQAEEQNHRALLNAIPDALLRLRADGTILDVQTGDLAFLTRPPAVADRNLSELIGPHAAELVLHHARQCLDTRTLVVFTTALVPAERGPVTAEIRVGPSGVGEVVVMLRDITAARQTEQAVVEAVAREQRRIGQDLHDGLGQELASIAVKAKILEETLEAAAVPGAFQAAELVRLVNGSIRLTRQLARGLEPVEVELGNLVLALERLAAESEATSRIPCAFECSLPTLQLPPSIGIQLYRIVQEAVRNAAQHAMPKSLSIQLSVQGQNLVLTVQDDGRGFNPAAGSPHGLGLHIMRYRANQIGASLTIESQPGRGTRLRCVVGDFQLGHSPAAS